MIPIEKITCDTECEKRNYTDQLIKTWNKTEPILYEDNVVEGFADTIDVSINVNPDASSKLSSIKSQFEIYKAQTTTVEKMKDVMKKLLKENENFKKDIDKDKSSIYTNDRKVVYEEWARDWLFTIGIALRSFYILVVVLYFYYGPLIKKNEWRTPRGWVIPGCLIIFPFLIYYITISLRAVYDKLIWVMNNKANKNVYV